ncbi:MAG: hypothetical protein IT538_14155 [Variibacter sp.]|nr:hypothetical protein [Variibacter sp.]
MRLAAVAVALAVGAGGCSTSYQLGALVNKAKPGEAPDTTGSVTPAAAPGAAGMAATPADLAQAKHAALALMARGANDSSLPWENPRSGARGTVTPLATGYRHEGADCRDFLVSWVRGEQQAWYQGGACRKNAKWDVHDLRPLHRT